MKPSSRDHQLGLASPLNYTAIQSGYVESSSKRERGLDVSHHAPGPHEGRGENFFLDILFHRMRRKGQPNRPNAITCCLFSLLKALLMSTKGTKTFVAVNVPVSHWPVLR